MIFIINALIANHLLMIFVSIIATVFLNSKKMQKLISFKVALYSFYSCLMVGFIFIATGNPLHIVDHDQNTNQFLSNLKSTDSNVADSGIVFSQKPIEPIYKHTLYFMLIAAAIGCGYFIYCLIVLVKSRKRLKQVRRIKSVSICSTRQKSIPYVFSLINRSYIVVPEEFLNEKKHLAAIIKHEFQHIRNLDTQLILFMSFLKSLLFINPAAHLAFKVFRQLHELAVDAEIIKKNSSQSYLETLSWVFQNSNFKTQPQLTNGFFGMSHFKEYKMRIFNISNNTQKKNNIFAMVILVFVGIFGVSCVSHLCKDKMSVNSLDSDQPSKEQFIVKFNITGENSKKSSMTVLTSLNKESVMLNSDDPQWLEKMDSETMNIPADSNLDYRKIKLVIEESESSWAKIRIKGLIVENEKRKEFEIANRVTLNEVFNISAIGADVLIKRK